MLSLDLSRGTREVVFLPTEFSDRMRYIKKDIIHQEKPKDFFDKDPDELFYQTKFQKYLSRPAELQHLKYKDFYRWYRLVSEKKFIAREDIAQGEHEDYVDFQEPLQQQQQQPPA